MIKKRCGNCSCYFINREWQKLCVEFTFGEDGKKHTVVKHNLGIMGNEQRACENWKPSKGYLRCEAARKLELKERRIEKARDALAKASGEEA